MKTCTKRAFTIHNDTYAALFKKQNGVCAICGRPEILPLCVDYNRKTLKIRGLLCTGCNRAVEFLEKEIWLQKARSYLQRNEQ